MRNAFRSPYGAMCHLCMYGLGSYVRRKGGGERSISYILETGDEGQKGLISFMQHIQGDANAKLMLDSYSLSGLTTTPKDGMERIFHSADFIAWEWGKHISRWKQGRPMRPSLKALTD